MTDFRYRIPHPDYHRDQLRIPQCHTLHACPPSCARHFALRAISNDAGRDFSFCYLTLLDMALGRQEKHIEQTVDDLLERLDPTPRAFLIKLYCIDELIGTDAHAMTARLSTRHPDIAFSVVRSSPLAERGVRGNRMQAGVYDLLGKTEDKDGGVNLVGRFNPLPATSEFPDVLDEWGISTVRSVASCKTFDEYRRIASSALDISVSWMGEATALELQRTLAIPPLSFGPAYGLEELDESYRRLYETLRGIQDSASSPDTPYRSWNLMPPEQTASCHAARARAEQAVTRAREVIGNVPIVIDTLATFIPFSMACALLVYGFNVKAVFAFHVKSAQTDALDMLEKRHPEVQIVKRPENWTTAGDSTIAWSGALSIGSDAATMTGSSMMLDMFHDEGCFGYDGIARLMDGLVKACEIGHAAIGEEESRR